MCFIIDAYPLMKRSVSDVRKHIDNADKKPLKDLRLFDLLIDAKKKEALRHGVYMFFNDDNECLYVGKCSSSHFAHRIGGHFGMSPKYGMNTFLKRLVKKLFNKEVDKYIHYKESYSEYVESIPKIANYGLLVINCNKKGTDAINKLERLFHIIYKPEFNYPNGWPKTYKNIDKSLILEDAITSL